MQYGSPISLMFQGRQSIAAIIDAGMIKRTVSAVAEKAFLAILMVNMAGSVEGYAQSVVVTPPTAENPQTCQIIINNGGTMQPSVDNKKMGSKEQRGTPGSVQVITTSSSFDLTMQKPLGFKLSPDGGGQNVVFSTTVSATGATSFTEIPGDFPVRLKRGITNLTTNLTVQNLDGPFKSGKYEADIKLRCE